MLIDFFFRIPPKHIRQLGFFFIQSRDFHVSVEQPIEELGPPMSFRECNYNSYRNALVNFIINTACTGLFKGVC